MHFSDRWDLCMSYFAAKRQNLSWKCKSANTEGIKHLRAQCSFPFHSHLRCVKPGGNYPARRKVYRQLRHGFSSDSWKWRFCSQTENEQALTLVAALSSRERCSQNSQLPSFYLYSLLYSITPRSRISLNLMVSIQATLWTLTGVHSAPAVDVLSTPSFLLPVPGSLADSVLGETSLQDTVSLGNQGWPAHAPVRLCSPCSFSWDLVHTWSTPDQSGFLLGCWGRSCAFPPSILKLASNPSWSTHKWN